MRLSFPMRYKIPDSQQVLELHPPVLRTFHQYRQTGQKTEAGGLLFAQYFLPRVLVVEATLPTNEDKRERHGFIPCSQLRRKLIEQRFPLGLHYIGEWHTHPVNKPSPSTLDLVSMQASFLCSKHELNYFVLIIVGTRISDNSLWVSLHNANQAIRLNPR